MSQPLPEIPKRGEAIAPEYFRLIAERTVDWESWLSREGELLWINDAVERITGYSPAECLAMPDYPISLVAPEHREQIAGQIMEACRGSTENNVAFQVLHRNGSKCRVGISWQPMIDEHGRTLGVRSCIRDIGYAWYCRGAARHH